MLRRRASETLSCQRDVDKGKYNRRSDPGAGGVGGTPLYGLYEDVPLDRVWFLASSALNRVCNFMLTSPRQGLNLS